MPSSLTCKRFLVNLNEYIHKLLFYSQDKLFNKNKRKQKSNTKTAAKICKIVLDLSVFMLVIDIQMIQLH